MKRGRHPVIPPSFHPILRQLYVDRDWGHKRITAYLADVYGLVVASATVKRTLRAIGVTIRPMGWPASKCRDCGKPTNGAMRCDWHRKIYRAIYMQDLRRERKNRV